MLEQDDSQSATQTDAINPENMFFNSCEYLTLKQSCSLTDNAFSLQSVPTKNSHAKHKHRGPKKGDTIWTRDNPGYGKCAGAEKITSRNS